MCYHVAPPLQSDVTRQLNSQQKLDIQRNEKNRGQLNIRPSCEIKCHGDPRLLLLSRGDRVTSLFLQLALVNREDKRRQTTSRSRQTTGQAAGDRIGEEDQKNGRKEKGWKTREEI